jgi:hypothetical protein
MPRYGANFVRRVCALEFEILRVLSRRYDMATMEAVFPASFREAFRELLYGVYLERSTAYLDALLDPVLEHGRELEFLRMTARVIRNLLISELIIAGDFGDRGPRIDRVIDTVMHQPNVAITWGNHDASWLGACLGSEACIATVLRISLRYRRLSQLEEGYGIPLAPLERLARTALWRRPGDALCLQGRGAARWTANGAHAEGHRDSPIQARGPTHRSQSAVRPRAPRSPPAHRSESRDHHARRRYAPAARYAFAHHRLGESERTQPRRSDLHRAAAPFVSAKPSALAADAVRREEGFDVAAPRRAPHLPRLRARG